MSISVSFIYTEALFLMYSSFSEQRFTMTGLGFCSFCFFPNLFALSIVIFLAISNSSDYTLCVFCSPICRIMLSFFDSKENKIFTNCLRCQSDTLSFSSLCLFLRLYYPLVCSQFPSQGASGVLADLPLVFVSELLKMFY